MRELLGGDLAARQGQPTTGMCVCARVCMYVCACAYQQCMLGLTSTWTWTHRAVEALSLSDCPLPNVIQQWNN